VVAVAARNPARNAAAELTVPPRAGKRLVFTNGCFDLLHRGHVSYLQAARALGDALVVALNSDASVRKLKGPGRPIVPQKDRAAVLRALRSVDAVVVFDENTPVRLMRDLKPNVYAKGGDHLIEDLPEAEVAGEIGAEVRIIPFEEGYSTAALIEKIKGLLDPGNLPG
jgi:D-beta-D-heptose 7-phosphate kinase/D-beta-D-heptose 1-phosphate adenosyltransferase